MGITFDYYNQIVNITSPTTQIDAQVLHDAIEDEMASPVGLVNGSPQSGNIIQPEGKITDPSNPTVKSQIIMILNSPWQIQFWGGSGYTRIFGGKLVGGLNDEPVKATGTAGDLTVLESPVDGLTVVSGSGVTAQDKLDIADQVWDEPIADHTGVGSTGEALDNVSAGASPSTIADAVWDELISGHTDSGSFGELFGKVWSKVRAIFNEF